MYVSTRFDSKANIGFRKKSVKKLKKPGIPKRNLIVLIAFYFIYLKIYLNVLGKMALLNAKTVIIYIIIQL